MLDKDKIQIRREVLEKRVSHSKIKILFKSIIITMKAIELIKKNQPEHVGIYFPIKQEVRTKLLILYLHFKKVNVYIPVVKSEREMDFCLLSQHSFTKRFFPTRKNVEANSKISKHKLDLVFVPLVAFNKHNFRIGYGGGYYDVYLKDHEKETVGLAFYFQLYDCDFQETAHDVSLSRILTD